MTNPRSGSLVILFCLCAVCCLAQSRPSLVVLPFESPAEISQAMDRFHTLLRISLTQSRAFAIRDEESVRVERVKRGDGSGAPVSRAAALDVGRSLDAQYVLVGKAERVGDRLLASVELVRTASGEVAFADGVFVTQDQPERAAQELGRKLARIARVVSDVRIEDVAQAVEDGLFDQAALLLERYRELHEDSTEARELEDEIRRARASELADEARRLQAVYLYDEALVAANAAVSLDPENVPYAELARAIQGSTRDLAAQGNEKLLAAVRELIQEERYDSADKLLTLVLARGYPAASAAELTDAINRGRRQRQLWLDAHRRLWERDFAEARSLAMEALAIDPTDTRYPPFLEEISGEERLHEQSIETWQYYRSSIARVDLVDLFVRRKTVESLASGSFSPRAYYDYRDGSTLVENSFPLAGASINYLRFIPVTLNLGLSFRLPFLEPRVLLSAGATARWGSSETESTNAEALRVLHMESVLYADVHAGAAAGLAVGSAFVGVGVAMNTGLARHARTDRVLSTAESVVHPDWFYSLGVGLDVLLGWAVSERVFLGLTWRRSINGLWGTDPNRERQRLGDWSLLLGYHPEWLP